MTLRLVALMSVVLLLSLAVFGLLTNHYQDQVMQEVARTASAVGKATLRTFDLDGEAAPAGLVRKIRTHYWTSRDSGVVAVPPPGILVKRIEVLRHGDPEDVEVVERVIDRATEDEEVVLHRRIEYVTDESRGAACIVSAEGESVRALGLADLSAQLFISYDDVHVESDPTSDVMILNIPRFTATDVKGGEGEVHDKVSVQLAKHDELRLPIPIADYDELFDSLRSRSLLLFVGVFLVGTILTAGVASRFTRPIRRLDAGIRRLSEGDLDVRVEVRGKDEITRLSQAFNDMTGKLREGRERSREMMRREKLSALGGLAAGVAHDVRNPLHSIGLTLQDLSETSRPTDPARAVEFDRALDMIRGEIRRLDQLVGNFLRFAKSERRETDAVDVADLLRETARLIKKEAEWRRIDVELDINEAVPRIVADGETLRASILNLVLNSFEAMPDGGTLSLALSVEGDAVVVRVGDTGCGIAEEDRERVFEFAYTTRESGTGLGLAMVHQCIVEEHGGRVSLDSAPGRGTRVRLALPLRPPHREEPS